MDDANTLVTIFGGSGFVGTQTVQALARKGYRIRVAVRRPDLAGHVKLLGGVGQVMPVQANVRYPDSIARAVAGADIVINLVGLSYQRGAQRFGAVQLDGARYVAEAARAAGVKQLVQVSILGASSDSASASVRTKADAETAVLEAFSEAIVIRCGVIFGPGDSLFNKLGTLARVSPVLPLIGARSRLQPVYVGDVADAFAMAAEGKVKTGRIYEVGGPEVVSPRNLLERVLKATGRNNPIVPTPAPIAKLLVFPLELLPFPPMMTRDQVDLLNGDTIVSQQAIKEKRTLEAFGIEPTAMDAVLPSYLWRFRRNGQFDRQPA